MRTTKYPEPSIETIAKIKGMFKGDYSSEEVTFEFQTKKDGYYIKVSKMYDYVSFVNGSVLQSYIKIAQLLNVQDGDEINRIYREGCETCDYGSSYIVELKFW